MHRNRRWLRPLLGAVILGLVCWRLGTGAVVHAVRGIDASALAAAAALACVTTVGGAWRWVLVARGLGIDLPLRSAVAESYRSQFLNVTLPGGVVGDVRRGVRHGRAAGDLGRGLRSVVWERTAGQVVLGALAVGALLLLPSPFASGVAGSGGLVAVVLLGALALVVALGALLGRTGRVPRIVRAAVADVRAGVLGRRTWPGVVAASGLVVGGHVATFVVAARSAGVTASSLSLLPLALLVLVAMGVPLNVAGWGPREGVAAWAFGAAGLGPAAGMGTAVVYGVLVLVASLPGAALLALSSRGGAPAVPVGEPVEEVGGARG
jgi:glycosyltransferase 2 family protein